MSIIKLEILTWELAKLTQCGKQNSYIITGRIIQLIELPQPFQFGVKFKMVEKDLSPEKYEHVENIYLPVFVFQRFVIS